MQISSKNKACHISLNCVQWISGEKVIWVSARERALWAKISEIFFTEINSPLTMKTASMMKSAVAIFYALAIFKKKKLPTTKGPFSHSPTHEVFVPGATMLANAANTFNAIIRRAIMHNIRIFCLPIATVTANFYEASAPLNLAASAILHSSKGATQGDDPLAMT